MSLKNLVAFAVGTLMLASASYVPAFPVIFQLETFGRLQSGPLVVGPITVTLTYRFDTNSPDAEPTPTAGSYASDPNVILTVGEERSTPINDGAGIFAMVDSPTSPTATSYIVGVGYPRGPEGSTILGRELASSTFVLLDTDGDMLNDDGLPFAPSFAARAEDFFTRIALAPIPGDPLYGDPAAYTYFDMCNIAITDVCVHAPITVRRMGLPEPDSIAIFATVLAAVVGTARRRSNG